MVKTGKAVTRELNALKRITIEITSCVCACLYIDGQLVAKHYNDVFFFLKTNIKLLKGLFQYIHTYTRKKDAITLTSMIYVII